MDTDEFLVVLQAAIRGYLLRRDLVQNVRSEYQEIFMQVEGGFNNNSVSWSGNKSLCYPTISLIQETGFTPVSPLFGDRESSIEMENSSPSIQKSVSEISLQDSLTDPLITTMDTIGGANTTQLNLTQNYPSSREELMRLQEQLSLELLWVRQAIQSRLQYLQALSRMHC